MYCYRHYKKVKYTYYDIGGRELRIPTHNAYANALLNKIYYYQNLIDKLIKKDEKEVSKLDDKEKEKDSSAKRIFKDA